MLLALLLLLAGVTSPAPAELRSTIGARREQPTAPAQRAPSSGATRLSPRSQATTALARGDRRSSAVLVAAPHLPRLARLARLDGRPEHRPHAERTTRRLGRAPPSPSPR